MPRLNSRSFSSWEVFTCEVLPTLVVTVTFAYANFALYLISIESRRNFRSMIHMYVNSRACRKPHIRRCFDIFFLSIHERFIHILYRAFDELQKAHIVPGLSTRFSIYYWRPLRNEHEKYRLKFKMNSIYFLDFN